MSFANALDYSLWVVLIEFAGALIIVAYVIAAIISLFLKRNITRARLIVADGIITGLSFKLAGTLLKTIQLRTWQQILIFAAILALRTLLKRFFTWEKRGLEKRLHELV